MFLNDGGYFYSNVSHVAMFQYHMEDRWKSLMAYVMLNNKMFVIMNIFAHIECTSRIYLYVMRTF